MSFQDHFSGHADIYQRYRPRYPAQLFEVLAAAAPARCTAWDVGCGNGQASVGLAGLFDQVIATDASATQIEQAVAHPRVQYRVAPAEASGLPDASIDLILIAQALHWFDLERFYAEARRVARPGALVCAVAYGLARITPDIDAAVLAFYQGDIGPYWPADRVHIETGYRDLPFPFARVDLPPVAMTATWTRADLVGYLGTWSAVARYRAATNRDPLPAIDAALTPLWPNAQEEKPVHWPLIILAGRVS